MPYPEGPITDWRGTPIHIGCTVVYHVVTRGGKTVEGVVRSITEGDVYQGRTLMVEPVQMSGITVGGPPRAYPRSDRRLMPVPHLKVTVIP